MRAASIEIFAVSPSRISPTITTSGSERRIDRSAAAKVSPARALICTWLMPGSRYSTGSSTVMMLIDGFGDLVQRREQRRRLTGAGRAGDEQRAGRALDDRRQRARASPRTSPSSSSVGGFFDLSSRRMTTDSPSTVGSVATRMSSMRPAAAALSEMRPSCGFRRSAMSSFASTFRRVVTPAAIRFGMRCTSWSTPSIRYRTTSASASGAKWTSEAPSSAAWKRTELTRRTSGASEMPSTASRSVSSSSAAKSRSAASSSSTASFAPLAPEARDELVQLDGDVVARGDARARADAGSRAAARRCCGGPRDPRWRRRPGRRRRTRTERRSRARARGAGRASRPPGRSPSSSRRPPCGRGWRGRRAAAGGAAPASGRCRRRRRPPPRRGRRRASPTAARGRARARAGPPGRASSPRADRRRARRIR